MEDFENTGLENQDDIGTQAYDISDAERDIALLKRDKADRSVTDDLTGRVTVMERDKANQSDMNIVTGRVTALERDKARQTDLDQLAGRVTGLSDRTTEVEINKADRAEMAALRDDVTGLTLGKADKAYVDAGLADKAGSDVVAAQGREIANLQATKADRVELDAKADASYPDELTTNDKTVPGAINEVHANTKLLGAEGWKQVTIPSSSVRANGVVIAKNMNVTVRWNKLLNLVQISGMVIGAPPIVLNNAQYLVVAIGGDPRTV